MNRARNVSFRDSAARSDRVTTPLELTITFNPAKRPLSAGFGLQRLSIFVLTLTSLFAQPVPIDDASGIYKGFAGGLYENRSNTIPTDHAARGQTRSQAIQPLDAAGNPSSFGRIVLLSIGISNAFLEWCGPQSPACIPESFTAMAAADSRVNHSTLVILNGAYPGQFADSWIRPTQSNYNRVLNAVLTPAGVTERQVQVVWLKVANLDPTTPLPNPNADAYQMQGYLGQIARALKVRYPNLQQLFVSSRIYAGYSTSTYSPEPFTYEYGWSVKWLIQAQITQARMGAVDSRAGDLSLAVAPWIAWGPYVWANGTTPNSGGLAWVAADYMSDRIHPNEAGVAKVAKRLMDFFLNDSLTQWFRAAGGGPPPDLPANAILNAASFALPNQTGYEMAPGSVVSLFGSGFASRLSVPSTPVLPITLDGAGVTFNGIPAPLFFVAPGQINAQLPFELPEGTVEAKIRTPAGESAGRTLQIAPTAPALYTYNQQGSGQAIVVHSNSTALAAPARLAPGSRPARAGDALTLFANGLGAVDPPIASGVNSCGTNGVCAADLSNVVLRRTVSAPTIEIGGFAVPAGDITFSGLAPLHVALYQINLVLPSGIPAGDAVPIVIRQGSASSRPDVTIAIQ